jgi:hypothetical protein
MLVPSNDGVLNWYDKAKWYEDSIRNIAGRVIYGPCHPYFERWSIDC